MPNLLDYAQATVTGDDALRLERRRGIRRQIAQRKQLEQRAAAIRERLKALDDEADAAADVHREQTTPVQVELEQLNTLVIELAADRQPVDPMIEVKRREFLEIIDDANDVLAESIASIESRRKPLQDELARLNSQTAQSAHLEFELSHQGIANPSLLIQKFVLEREKVYADARLRDARRKVESIESEIGFVQRRQSAGSIEELTLRLQRWQAERDAALAEVNRLGSEANELHQRIIEE